MSVKSRCPAPRHMNTPAAAPSRMLRMVITLGWVPKRLKKRAHIRPMGRVK